MAKQEEVNEWCQTVEDVRAKEDTLPSFAAMAMKKKKDPQEELVYVNLPDNKESYTAYDGMPIWSAIYQENCMLERVRSKGIKLDE